MADIDPIRMLNMPGEITGAPSPRYNFLEGIISDPGMAQAMAMIAPQFLQYLGVGGNAFLPQQVPGQLLMDQMASAKYMADMRANTNFMMPRDQKVMAKMFTGVGSSLGFNMTPMAQNYMNNFAGIINHPGGQMVASMLLGGPQNVEDIFFGRRGSAVQLASSVNALGFYRPDSVTGADRMTGDSLKQFTEQLYGNLYGPGANLNDISGLSAGRVGTMATELARRGLLPQSLSTMPNNLQMTEMRANRPENFEQSIAKDLAHEAFTLAGTSFKGPDGKPVKYADLDGKSRQAIIEKETADPASEFRRKAADVNAKIDDNKSTFEDIANMAGGAEGIRRIDATRVGNKLKDYSGAISAIRTIFGDAGMGNAPMQQLIAGLDALTQGGMSSMGAGRLENVIRRTQMASKDSGVSLEALMGLTSRAGALADQNGLNRAVVPEAVIATMERGQAMRDSGAFMPGFGKMDKDKATLFALDQVIRSDASRASRKASVARRLVKENEGNKEFADRAGADDLRAFVAAYERGDSTFVDSAGKTVDISQALGENADNFFADMFKRAGFTPTEVSSRYYDAESTEENLLSGRVIGAQRYRTIQRNAGKFAEDMLRQGIGNSLPEQERNKILASVGRSFATAQIDDVDNSMTQAERVNVLQGAMRRGVENYAREKLGAKATEDQVNAEVERLTTTPGGLFTSEAQMRSIAGTEQAEVARYFRGMNGMTIQDFRTSSGIRVQSNYENLARRHRAKASLAQTLGGADGDGSNFLQRLSEYFIDGRAVGASFAQYVLNTIDDVGQQKELIALAGGREAFENATNAAAEQFSEATVDTDKERDEVIKDLVAAGAQETVHGRGFRTKERQDALKTLKERFKTVPGGEAIFHGKTTVVSTEELAANMDRPENEAVLTAAKAAYESNLRNAGITVKPGEVDAIFSDDKKRKQALTELAQDEGIRKKLSSLGVSDAAMESIGLGGYTLTEKELNRLIQPYAFLAGKTPTQIARSLQLMQSSGQMMREMGSGKLKASTILDVVGEKITDGDKKKTLETKMEEALSKYDDDKVTVDKDGKTTKESATMTAVKAAAEAATADLPREEAEKIQQKIIDTTNLARAQRIYGGFDSMQADARPEKIKKAARLTAIREAVKAGTIQITADDVANNGNSFGEIMGELDRDIPEERKKELREKLDQKGLGAILTQLEKEKDPKRREELQKALDRGLSGSDEEVRKRIAADQIVPDQEKDGGRVSSAVDRVMSDAKRIEEATGGKKDQDGPFAGLATQISGAISSAFTSAVAQGLKDVKIQNVTIDKLTLSSNILSSLIAGLFSSGNKDGITGTPQKQGDATAPSKPVSTETPGKPPSPTTVPIEDQPAVDRPRPVPAKPPEKPEPPVKSVAETTKTADASEKLTNQLKTTLTAAISTAMPVTSSAAQAADAGIRALTARVTFNNLHNGILELMPQPMEPTPGNGAPVIPTNINGS